MSRALQLRVKRTLVLININTEMYPWNICGWRKEKIKRRTASLDLLQALKISERSVPQKDQATTALRYHPCRLLLTLPLGQKRNIKGINSSYLVEVKSMRSARSENLQVCLEERERDKDGEYHANHVGLLCTLMS